MALADPTAAIGRSTNAAGRTGVAHEEGYAIGRDGMAARGRGVCDGMRQQRRASTQPINARKYWDRCLGTQCPPVDEVDARKK